MALLFCDSFDHYASTDFLSKWSVSATTANAIGSSGRFNSGFISANSSNSGGYLIKTLQASYGTLIAGFAIKWTGISSTTPSTSADPFFGFLENGTVHIDLRTNGSGIFYVTRNGTTLGTGTTPLTSGVWYYVEMKAVIHDTAGSVELRLNGVTEISLSGIDTRNGANGVITQIKLGCFGNAPQKYFDDLYVCDTSGSVNNDFLGDVRIEALFPNGNGAKSNLVGSDSNSTDNYLLVDEATPNADTDYVESSTVGDKDTYTFTDLTSTAGTVRGIQLLPYARKTDAGTSSIKAVTRLSGTEEDAASDSPLSTSYVYYPDIRETKPGGGAWSISDINSAEFGVKVTA